jgi:hypothetical protein
MKLLTICLLALSSLGIGAHAQTDTAAVKINLGTADKFALLGAPCGTNLTGKDLGGMRLGPGLYCFSSSAALTGTLTLDAHGNPNSRWIFQIGSTLTTATNSKVTIVLGHNQPPLGQRVEGMQCVLETVDGPACVAADVAEV